MPLDALFFVSLLRFGDAIQLRETFFCMTKDVYMRRKNIGPVV